MQAGENNHARFIVTLSGQKGGIGKTTTVACIGAELAKLGKKCLLLDLAPSGNLTSAFGFNIDDVNGSTADLFRGTAPLPGLVQETMIKGLDLLPANASLAPIPRELYQKAGYETILRDILNQDGFFDYDLLILDCPPGLDSITVNAIASADLALLPLTCEMFSLATLDSLFRLIRLSRERVNPHLSYRLLITKMDHQVALHESIYKQVREHYQNALLKTIIERDMVIPESQLAGIPLLKFSPNSLATKQYSALTKEILGLIHEKINPTNQKEVKQ